MIRIGPRTKLLLGSLAGGLLWVGAGGALVVLYAVLVAPYRVTVEQVAREYHNVNGRTGALRVAFFSDLELTGPPGRREGRVLRMVRDLGPDLVAIGGDILGGDRTEVNDDDLAAIGTWLEQVAAAAKYGAVVVWGEQEAKLAARLQASFPAGVQVLENAQVVLPAGDARLRVCGPQGHFGTLEAARERLLGWAGRTTTLATFEGEGARQWASVEITARLRIGVAGDGPGLAVLVGETDPGVSLGIAPGTMEWRVTAGMESGWEGRRARPGGFPAGTWIQIRIQVQVGEAATNIRSRAWREGEDEPTGWSIRLTRDDKARPRSGTVGIVIGGSPFGGGLHEWDDLRVTGPGGELLLDEPFTSPERFTTDWVNPGGTPRDFDATLLLLHDPAVMLEPGRPNFVDLVLAGHTQGGQVRLGPFGPAGMDPRLPSGWIAGGTRLYDKNLDLYVTRGVGVSPRLPARLWVPPEVTDLTVRMVPRPD